MSLYGKDGKEYEEWILAHKIVGLAVEKKKAIVFENLNRVDKGYRGDGKAKLRKRLSKWNYKSLLSKIEILAKRNGIEVRKVNPAYTSVIGKLKYAPQYNIDKDIAGAYVIAIRGLGFKEKLPKNYRKLLENSEYLNYTLQTLKDKKQKLKEKLNQEKNIYNKDPIKKFLKEIEKDIKTIQSLQSEPSFCKGADGRNSLQIKKTWQVLRVALVFPVLEKYFVRDYSSLKSLMISGMWDKKASRLAPFQAGGTFL
jgi:IS605 OrfB family transposase